MKKITFLFCLLISTFGYAQITLPIDFESTTVVYTFTDFGGGVFTKESNPDQSGINTSANVAKMVKDVPEVYGGSLMELAAPIDFSVNKTFKMKVWAPAVGTKVLLKVENLTNGGIFFEKEELTTTANAWEELTFDFSAINTAEAYQKLVIIFDNGTVGDGSAAFTYYVDDIELVFTTPVVLPDLPITFEDPTLNYDLLDFEGGGPSTIVVDPTDPTNMVVQVVKDINAGTSAGALVGVNGIANPIPFTAGNTSMSVRVWSPDAGIQVRLKVEDAGNNGISVETEATTTVAMAWETLTFDFSNQASGTAAINLANTYNKIAIFFNFGVDGATAGEKTYFYDDIQFGGGGGQVGITLPIDFESTTVVYTFTDFGGGVLTKETNPDQSGINTSANVAKMVKNAPEVFGGSLMELAAPINFSVNKTFKMKVWAPAVGTKVLLKVENLTNGGIFFEQEEVTTTAMAWEELTFDFSAINTAETYQKIVIIFDNGTVGDGSAAFTYYLDDIELTSGGSTGNGITLPIDFESTTVVYTFVDFGGGVLTKETNPDQSGINTSANVAKMVKNAPEVFGGSLMELAAPIDFSVNKTFKMKVWAPAVGTKVLLKVENLTNGGIFFEQEEVTTTAMAWEELTFNFGAINTAESYQKVVIIFDNGTVGDGSAAFTYYLDDIELTTGGTNPISEVDLPITFEDTMIDYGLTDFGGNTSLIVVDPTDPTNLVGQAIRSNTAETFAGTTMSDIGLANPIPFTATESKMTVRVWSPDAGIQVRLKVENTNNAGITAETEATTTVAMAWETLEFDFSNVASGTAAYDPTQTFDKITIFFNFGVLGADAGEKTYYWDDVMFGPITSIKILNAADSGIKISPNPSSSFFNIEFPEALTEPVHMMLFDVNGKLLKEGNMVDQISQINVSELNSGMYFLRMDRGGVSYFQKVMVSK